jgi:hypothetical protein
VGPMSERISGQEEQDVQASPVEEVQAPKTREVMSREKFLRRQLANQRHDVQDCLNELVLHGAIVSMEAPELVEVGNKISGTAKKIDMRLKVNVTEPQEPMPAAEFRNMVEQGVEDVLRSDELKEILAGRETPRVELRELPDSLHAKSVPACAVSWLSILKNVIHNSARKEAKEIVIAFDETTITAPKMRMENEPAVRVSLRDDGVGMPPELVKDLQEHLCRDEPFKRYTDKTLGKGIRPGETKKDHGIGLQSIRDIIEHGALGRMWVESVQATSESPGTHGTVIMLHLPLINGDQEKSSGELPAVPSHSAETPPVQTISVPESPAEPVAPVAAPMMGQSPSHLRTVTRRAAILAIATGGAAIAWRLSTSRDQESGASSPEGDPSPLSAITLDEKGNIESFTFDLHGRTFTYTRGEIPEGFFSVQEVPLQAGSLVSFNLRKHQGTQLRPMFVCSTGKGIFAQIDVPQGHSQKMAFICAPREADARTIAVSDKHVFLLTDTVVNGAREYSTNTKLLESAELESMAPSLSVDADILIKRKQHIGNAAPLVIKRLLDARADWKKGKAFFKAPKK